MVLGCFSGYEDSKVNQQANGKPVKNSQKTYVQYTRHINSLKNFKVWEY